MNVELRLEASGDLVDAAAYFNDKSDGWGDHFLECIDRDFADLDREAVIHATQHIKENVCSSSFNVRIQARRASEGYASPTCLRCGLVFSAALDTGLGESRNW